MGIALSHNRCRGTEMDEDALLMPPPPPRPPKRQRTAAPNAVVTPAAATTAPAGEPTHPESISIVPARAGIRSFKNSSPGRDGGGGGRSLEEEFSRGRRDGSSAVDRVAAAAAAGGYGTAGAARSPEAEGPSRAPSPDGTGRSRDGVSFRANGDDGRATAAAAGVRTFRAAPRPDDAAPAPPRDDGVDDYAPPHDSNEVSAGSDSAPGVEQHGAKKIKRGCDGFSPPVGASFQDIIGHGQAKLRLEEALLPLALPSDLADSILTGVPADE